jgi:hypothetical protein
MDSLINRCDSVMDGLVRPATESTWDPRVLVTPDDEIVKLANGSTITLAPGDWKVNGAIGFTDAAVELFSKSIPPYAPFNADDFLVTEPRDVITWTNSVRWHTRGPKGKRARRAAFYAKMRRRRHTPPLTIEGLLEALVRMADVPSKPEFIVADPRQLEHLKEL